MDDLVTWIQQQLENQRHTADALKALAHALPAETGAYLTETAGLLLADVDAKRRILDLHAPTKDSSGRYPMCSSCGELDCCPEPWPCPTVRALAQPHADRPGYRDEWRPE